MAEQFFEWTEQDHQDFKDFGNLDQGKWTFYYHEKNDEYEATMHGIYTHVFNTLDDMLHRRNEVDEYEYDIILTQQRGEETITNSDGKIREY